MKRNVFLVLLLVVALSGLLVACGGQAEPAVEEPETSEETTASETEGEEAASEEETFKFGLLSPGSVNDEGWNSIAYNALLRIEDELGAETSYVELGQDPAAYEKAFRDFASQGYQMILGHGFEFQDAALTVSKDYPDTYFFISSSRVHEGNVIGLNTDSSQPFYLMGVMAAHMADGAGFVGGLEIPPIAEAMTGFVNGVESVDPDFRVSTTYIGNFTDSAAAKEATVSMISEGINFIVPDADVAGLGVFQAISEAGEGYYTFGAFTDSTEHAPDNILGNYLADYGQGIVNVARAVKEGTFEPTGNIEFGLANEDVMWIEYNPDVPMPEEVKAAVSEAEQAIINGEIDTLAE